MSGATYTILPDKSGRTVAIQGDWSSLTIGADALELPSAIAGARGPTRLDLSKAGRIDTAGAYLILKATLPTLEPSPMAGETEKLFALVRPAVEGIVPSSATTPWLSGYLDRVGRAIAHVGSEILRIASFSGHTWVEIARTIRSPRKLRVISLAHMMEVAGVDALPIIMMLNFFIGAVVALVGASLLTSLGVAVFTVQLVGVAVVREFAVLFTGILLAGRSASSFAAQIGSMKMAQEIDAMQVIGVDPYQALVLPRVFALLLMMPVQIFAAMVSGIAGGLLICWAMLDMSPVFFLQRLHDTVPIRHFWVGMSKAPVLAVLVALAGCRHGLFVGNDVESLGARVTSAVVQAIVVIIIFDALFAIVYMELKL